MRARLSSRDNELNTFRHLDINTRRNPRNEGTANRNSFSSRHREDPRSTSPHRLSRFVFL